MQGVLECVNIRLSSDNVSKAGLEHSSLRLVVETIAEVINAPEGHEHFRIAIGALEGGIDGIMALAGVKHQESVSEDVVWALHNLRILCEGLGF